MGGMDAPSSSELKKVTNTVIKAAMPASTPLIILTKRFLCSAARAEAFSNMAGRKFTIPFIGFLFRSANLWQNSSLV